jgi:hypothetical protein
VGDGPVPQVLVPYPGPDPDQDVQDIFVYLRPETNGVLVESTLLGVIKGCAKYRNGISLIYLANVPGQFILDHHIIEQHYAHKLYFAVHGKKVFTPHMRESFSDYFGVTWSDADIIGSFEALRILGLSPEELFRRWVPRDQMLTVDGQTIKRFGELFVVNYDIPALLHKNNRGTDIAVMVFRCRVSYDYFEGLVDEMQSALVEREIVSARIPVSRTFHYSRGPFEQLLDAIDYLYTPDGAPVPLSDLSFVRYAEKRGYGIDNLMGLIKSPICLFGTGDILVEENVFAYTLNDSYKEAVDKLKSLRAQLWIRRYK